MISSIFAPFRNLRPTARLQIWKYDKGQQCSCMYSTTTPQVTPQFFRHCDRATTEPIEGEVQGHIPPWLHGSLIRNGAGILKVGKDHYRHIFDGMAVLHKYDIQNGKVNYMSRPLEGDTYKKNMKANRIVVSEFGTVGFPDPCKSIFQRFSSTFSSLLKSDATMTDNCNVNVGFYGDQLYAMTETNVIRQIDPTNLEVVGPRTCLTDYVAVHHASAHPHVLEDGSILNMGNNYKGKKGPHYCVVKIPPTFGDKGDGFEEAEILVQIPFSSPTEPAYYHSFGMTKDKIIFIETPLRLDMFKLIKAGFFGKTSFAECLMWCPDKKARFHVVSLIDGKSHPVIYETDPFFTFHHINAYEEDDQIVVDVAGYDRGEIVTNWEENAKAEDTKMDESEATGRRFVLPLNVSMSKIDPEENIVTLKNCTATATSDLENDPKDKDFGKVKVQCVPQHLTKEWVELPRINYKYNGQKHNYFYAISSLMPPNHTSPEADSIVKVDVNKNETLRWKDSSMIPSEPIFVPSPDSLSEDDGVVVSALMHRNEETANTLLILNAKNFEELARVRFNTAGTFTSTFHGQWASASDTIHRY